MATGDDIRMTVHNNSPANFFLTDSHLSWPSLLTADGKPAADAFVNWFRFSGGQYYDGDDPDSPTGASPAPPGIPLNGSSTAEWRADFGAYTPPLVLGDRISVELTFAPGSCTVTGTLYPIEIEIIQPALSGMVITSRGQTGFEAEAQLLDGGATRGNGIRRVRFQLFDPAQNLLLDHSAFLPPYCTFGKNQRRCNFMPTDLWRSLLPSTYKLRSRAEAQSGIWSPWIVRSFVIPEPPSP